MESDGQGKRSKEAIDAMVKRFRSCIVHHRNFKNVLKELKDAISVPGGDLIVLLIAPSYAGKSTLLKVFVNEVINQYHDEMVVDPNFIPIAAMEAPPAKYARYSWNNHFVLGLEALSEPLIAKKIILATEQIKDGPSKYERAYEKCLINRGTKVIGIDEAQHIGRCLQGDRFLNQFDILKSLVNRTGVYHVLFGVYELARLLDVSGSGQFINRMRVVHFPRYFRSSEDLAQFGSVLRSLRKQLPIESDSFETKYLDYCYDQTIGCIGMLSKWLADSVHLALTEGAKKLTIDHLQKRARTRDSLDVLRQEAKKGEERLAKALMKNDYKDYTKKSPAKAEATPASTPQSRTRQTPGKRKPGWDEVGAIGGQNGGK